MKNVAADGNVETMNRFLPPADGQGIKQRLGRVFVVAVTGIDDRAVDLVGEKTDSSRVGMAHNQKVRTHGVERQGRVDQ